MGCTNPHRCPLGVGSKLLLPIYDADVWLHIPMTHRNDAGTSSSQCQDSLQTSRRNPTGASRLLPPCRRRSRCRCCFRVCWARSLAAMMGASAVTRLRLQSASSPWTPSLFTALKLPAVLSTSVAEGRQWSSRILTLRATSFKHHRTRGTLLISRRSIGRCYKPEYSFHV